MTHGRGLSTTFLRKLLILRSIYYAHVLTGSMPVAFVVLYMPPEDLVYII
ncbi:hypothetical protein K437DRAFT_253648, partial [Tilletiaria anomala UBC 951]